MVKQHKPTKTYNKLFEPMKRGAATVVIDLDRVIKRATTDIMATKQGGYKALKEFYDLIMMPDDENKENNNSNKISFLKI